MKRPRRQPVVTGVFGGSFDPPHCGHVMVVAWLLSCTDVREVFVIPCFQHAFGKQSASFECRVKMCRLAFEVFGRRVKVLDIESRLPVPSYTIQTLRHLVAFYPNRKFKLIVGSDILPETSSWREWNNVITLASVVVMRREGFEDPPHARGPRFPDVSSTAIRKALSQGEDVSGLVPEKVLKVIKSEKLYGFRESAHDARRK